MRTPKVRRFFYVIVPLLAPVLALLMLEGGFRAVDLGRPSIATDPGRGFLPFDSLFREEQGAEGEPLLVVETPPHDLPFMDLKQFNAQVIPAKKEAGEYRIVFVGGSVVYGWPYDDRLSVPRLLEVGLAAVHPGRRWRVINMGAPGWGSTRLRLLADDLTRLDADLVVVMTGHNEGIEAEFAAEVFSDREARVRLLSTLARRSHLVTWMTTHLPTLEHFTKADDGARRRHAMQSVSERRDILVSTFADNLEAMVSTHLEAGSEVLLAGMASNVRSCPPFGPDRADLAGSMPELAARFDDAEARLASGDTPAALELVTSLSEALPGDANVRYLLGRVLEASGRDAEARAAYYEALDLDPTIARAFGGLNSIVARIAEERDLPLVDLVASMAASSKWGAPGYDLFRDNCHPNRAGTVVIAKALARSLVAQGIFEPETDWEGPFERAVEDYVGGLEIPPELELEAAKFDLFYFRVMNPDPVRERAALDRLGVLDPEGRANLP